MPNALTHYTFAKDVALDEGEHLLAAYLGAQGPDPFFFFGADTLFFHRHAKAISSLGGITQHEPMAPTYWAMMEYAQKSENKDLLFAYIDGLLMHYVVDCACHPYIFYCTGFTDRPEDPPAVHHHYNFSHMCFEVDIDFIYAKQKGTYQRVDKVLALNDRDLRIVSLMWYDVNKIAQKVTYIQKDSFYRAVKDYRYAQRLAWDKNGKKKAFAKKVFGKESFYYGMIYPQSLKGFESVDFLNESHHPWKMPAGEERTESFLDLLEEAKNRYRKLHALLLEAKAGEDVHEALDKTSEGLNHEGIIPNSPKLYWKLVWPKDFLVDYPGYSSR